MWAEYRNAGVAMRTADQEIRRPRLFPVSPQAGWGTMIHINGLVAGKWLPLSGT